MTQLELTVDAVRRTVETRRDGATVHLSLTLSAPMELPPADLWDLLVTPALIASWYQPLTGDFTVGGTITTPSGSQGRVLDAEAPHRARLAWSRNGITGPLEIRVDPQDDGSSELTVLRSLPVPRARFDAEGPGAIALPWDVLLERLARRTGSWGWSPTVAPAPLETWMRSAEAVASVRAWAIRWAAAAIADGAEESEARRAEAAAARVFGMTPADAPAPSGPAELPAPSGPADVPADPTHAASAR